MRNEEIDQLYLELRRKKLTYSQLSQSMSCSVSLLSKFFKHECSMSEDKVKKLKHLITTAKEYQWRKVEV